MTVALGPRRQGYRGVRFQPRKSAGFTQTILDLLADMSARSPPLQLRFIQNALHTRD